MHGQVTLTLALTLTLTLTVTPTLALALALTLALTLTRCVLALCARRALRGGLATVHGPTYYGYAQHGYTLTLAIHTTPTRCACYSAWATSCKSSPSGDRPTAYSAATTHCCSCTRRCARPDR